MKQKVEHSKDQFQDCGDNWFSMKLNFQEFHHLVTQCEPAKSTGEWELSSVKGQESFTKTKTWDHAVQLFNEGWEEGLEKVAEISETISNTVKQQLPEMTFQYDVTGGMVDVGTMMSGVPECMLNFNEQETSATKYVELHFNASVSGGVSTNVIENRGAAMMALIDALETMNYRTKVVMHDTAVGGVSMNHQYTLKEYDEPLERDRMAFMCLHPSSLRRLGFRLMEFACTEFRKATNVKRNGGYGMPAHELPARIFDTTPDLIIHGINLAVVDGKEVETAFNTAEQSIKWVLDILQGLDVPLMEQIEMND